MRADRVAASVHTKPRALILVGDPGEHGDLFTRAANTEAAAVRAMGGQADVVQVRSHLDVALAMGTGGPIARLSFYGHSSEWGLHVSMESGAFTNVDLNNVDSIPSSNMASGAEVFLYGCNAGVGADSIAEALSVRLDRTVHAWTSSSHFKSNPGYATAPPWTPPRATGPLYMRPDNGQPFRVFNPPSP